jgi:hypothetical protein
VPSVPGRVLQQPANVGTYLAALRSVCFCYSLTPVSPPTTPTHCRLSLQVNFKGIWSNFGDVADGGCPGCFENIVDFWCAYTCSPNQTDFVLDSGLAQKVDPVSGNEYTVFVTNVTLDASYACDGVFDSCASTAKVKEFTPLQTCNGFFQYQGHTEAIETGLSFINFDYVNASSTAMSEPVYSCCSFPSTISPITPGPGNGTNTSCPCTACAGMCPKGACQAGQLGGYY